MSRGLATMIAACFGWIPIAAALQGSGRDRLLQDWGHQTGVTLTGWLELPDRLALDDDDDGGSEIPAIPLELYRSIDECGPRVEDAPELHGLPDPEDQVLALAVRDLGWVTIRGHRFADPWETGDGRRTGPSYLVAFDARMTWGQVVAAVERLQATRPASRFLLDDEPATGFSASDP